MGAWTAIYFHGVGIAGGAFFGVVDAKRYWQCALLPVMFLASAIAAGSAMLLAIRGIVGVDSTAAHGDSDPDTFVATLSRLRTFDLWSISAATNPMLTRRATTFR